MVMGNGTIMAKDDYDFLVLKILTYLYGCLQRKYHFDTSAFTQQIITKTVSEAYIVDVLRMMNEEAQQSAETSILWGFC